MTFSRLYIRVGPLVATRLKPNRYVLIHSQHNTSLVVDRQLTSFLLSCTQFCTPTEHARSALASQRRYSRAQLTRSCITFLQHQEVNQTLRHSSPPRVLEELLLWFYTNGYFISRDEFLTLGTPPNRNMITSLNVVTRDRPEELSRALISYTGNFNLHKRTVDIVIYDDSHDKQTLDILSAQKNHFQQNVFYAGQREKENFTNELIKRGIRERSLRCALYGIKPFGGMYGANRNALLLDAVGSLGLMVDDDTVCNPHLPIHAQKNIRIGSERFPQEVHALDTPDKMKSLLRPTDTDIIAEHENILGTDPRHLAQKSDFDTQELDRHLLALIMRNKCKTILTINGLFGDSAMQHSFPLMFMSGNIRDELLRSEADLRSHLSGRDIVKASPQLTLCRPKALMTTYVGFDARELLPPMFPILRGSDMLFGFCLEKMHESALYGYLPLTLQHAPSYHRVNATHSKSTNGIYPMHFVALLLTGYWPAPHHTASSRLQFMGNIILETANLPTKDFYNRLQVALNEQVIRDLVSWEKLFDENPGFPLFWKNEVSKQINHLRCLLADSTAIIPKLLLTNFKEDDAVHVYQELIRDFGQLMMDWESILDTAKKLKQQGIGLTRRL